VREKLQLICWQCHAAQAAVDGSTPVVTDALHISSLVRDDGQDAAQQGAGEIRPAEGPGDEPAVSHGSIETHTHGEH